MLDETIVRRNTGESLRATIPKAVINLLGLKEEDKLKWSVEAIPGKANGVRVYVEKS